MATRSTEAVPNEADQPDQVGCTSQDWTGSGLLAGDRVRHVPGTGSPWRWFFSGVWLVYLIQPVAQLFHSHDVVQIQSSDSDATLYAVIDAGYRPREIEVTSLGLEQAFLAITAEDDAANGHSTGETN